MTIMDLAVFWHRIGRRLPLFLRQGLNRTAQEKREIICLLRHHISTWSKPPSGPFRPGGATPKFVWRDTSVWGDVSGRHRDAVLTSLDHSLVNSVRKSQALAGMSPLRWHLR